MGIVDVHRILDTNIQENFINNIVWFVLNGDGVGFVISGGNNLGIGVPPDV